MCSHLRCFFFSRSGPHRYLHSFPTRRSSDLSACPVPRDPSGSSDRPWAGRSGSRPGLAWAASSWAEHLDSAAAGPWLGRSEEHTSELQSRQYLVCRLLLEKKKKHKTKEHEKR